MGGPTGDRMIRVDMTNQTTSIEPYPEDWKFLGGRSLSARILLSECDPTCDPTSKRVCVGKRKDRRNAAIVDRFEEGLSLGIGLLELERYRVECHEQRLWVH